MVNPSKNLHCDESLTDTTADPTDESDTDSIPSLDDATAETTTDPPAVTKTKIKSLRDLSIHFAPTWRPTPISTIGNATPGPTKYERSTDSATCAHIDPEDTTFTRGLRPGTHRLQVNWHQNTDDDDDDDESVPSLALRPYVDSSDEDDSSDDESETDETTFLQVKAKLADIDGIDQYIHLFLDTNDPDKPLDEPILPLTSKFVNTDTPCTVLRFNYSQPRVP